MKVIQGDLLKLAKEGQFDVVIHGCNCQCTMSKGIALSIKQQFPAAYAADLQTEKGNADKLGTISTAEVEMPHGRLVVVNAYTQLHYRGSGVRADYDAIRRAFQQIKNQFHGRRMGYPKIGAGLAKGDWQQIAAIIDEALVGEEHTLVEFVPGPALPKKESPKTRRDA